MTCTVVSESNLINNLDKIVIPDHRLMQIPFESEKAAHFVCGALNSVISRFIVHSYTVSTQLSTHILENVPVPKYSEKNKHHREIARLAKQAHKIVLEDNKSEELIGVETKIDSLVANIFDIDTDNLEAIRKELNYLEEL